MSKYPLTLIGVLGLATLLVVAALLLNEGEQGQRFTIIVGVIATTITALLALLRTEITAKDAQVVREAVVEDKGVVRKALDKLSTDLAANTAISVKAYDSANNFSERLVAQGRQFDALLNSALVRHAEASPSALLEEVAATTASTEEKVTEIRDKVVNDG